MVKHILGQAIFQSIVILTILFGGSQFIAEEFCGAGSDYAGQIGVDYCGGATTELITFQAMEAKLKT